MYIKTTLSALALVAVTTTSAIAACPPWDPQAQRFAQLSADIKETNNAAKGQELSREMWRIWANAPDGKAKDILVRGQRARESYDYDTALSAFNELVTYCPDYAEGYNQRAFIHFLKQDFEPALADLELALARNPNHIAAKAGMALTLLNMGRFEAGQVVLREAVAMNPWLPERGMLVAPSGTTENGSE